MQTNNSKEKVRQLQNKLYLTAKKCDSRRFHALYDKVYRDDVLFEAWKRVKANKGSSGVDGIRIEDIEEMGIEKYLSEIKLELMDGKYKPSPVKRTNPDAAIKGIQAMNRPTLLIGGGYDKGSSYDEWLNAFDGKVRYLVLIGQTRDKIKEAAERLGVCPCILCENLEEAVKVCAEKANPGDAVLLSPACASWGQFDNYEQRGDMFKEYVRNL